MSKKMSSKLQLILKFLDPKSVEIDKLKRIDDVLKLPLSAFKFLGEKDVKNFQKLFKISKIKDLTKYNQEEPFKELYKSEENKQLVEEILKDNPELIELIKKAITISILMELIKQKSISIEREKQKVVILGLDNAGKTAIVSKIGGRLEIENLAEIKPTIGINFQEIATPDMDLMIWDFGGQKQYRKNHLSKEANFINTNLLMYVIDVQDSARFEESFQYLEKIIKILDRIEVNPQIIVLIHKYDPDIRDDPEISLQAELVKDTVNILLKNKNIDYEIYLSSIYSLISTIPKFSLSIKDILNDADSFIYDTEATTQKIKSLGEAIKNTLNAVIKISEYCNELERRMNSFESIITSQGQLPQTVPGPISASPLPPPPPPPKDTLPQKGGLGVRASILNELKDIFAKRKELDLL